MPNSALDLSEPQRQSVVGVGIIFIQKLRRAINIFISILVIQFGMKADFTSFWLNGTIGLIFVGLLVAAVLTYRNFFFYATADAFIIEKGVLGKERITVPFERIQTVNINQNLIQRLLGVVGLNIDTAGSSAKELEIAALPKAMAKQIQSFLMESKVIALEEEVGEEETVLKSKNEQKALVELSLRDLIKIGLTENHLRTAGILFALISGYFWQFQQYFEDYSSQLIEDNSNWLNSLIAMQSFIALAFILGIGLFSIVQAILKFYGLRFYCDEEGVKLESGLLKRVSYQIPENKIQLIKWSTNPLRKIVGFKTVVVKQASSVELNDKLSIMIPACNETHLERILANFFPEQTASAFKSYAAQDWFRYQLILLFALLPAALWASLGFYESAFFIIAAIWFIAASPLSWMYAKRMRLKSNREMIELQRAWVFPQHIFLHYYKLQSVQFKQNVFQKRRGLAHLVFHTAAGSYQMWQMDEKEALEIYNYALFKIETAQKSWM